MCLGARHQHHEVVRVAHEAVHRQTVASASHSVGVGGHQRVPGVGEVFVERRERDVGQQWRQDATLRGASLGARDGAVLGEDPGDQERLDQAEYALVRDSIADTPHQGCVVDLVKARGDVTLEHPLVGEAPEVIDLLDRVLGSAHRAKAVTARPKVRLEDRLEDQLEAGLHDTVTRGRDPQQAVKQGNVTGVTVLSEKTDATGQLAQIRDLIAKGVKVLLINPADKDSLNPAIKEAIDAGIAVVAIDAYLVKGQGETEFLARAILYAIERKRAQERLTYLAQYDQLTGLVNRTLFRDRLVHAMARSKRKDQPVGIMLLDLDRFKMVNDTCGHDIGDQLLKSVADRLKNCVREVDTIARMGGDEFTAILEGISGEQDVAVVARRIVESITEPFILGQGSVSIGVSIGITLYPLDDQNVDGLLKHADAAMYRAKAQGGNSFQFHSVPDGRDSNMLSSSA